MSSAASSEARVDILDTSGCRLTAEFSGRLGADLTRPRPSTLWHTDRCNDLLGDKLHHPLKCIYTNSV